MLEDKVYCPILHARQGEVKALFQLPPQSKDRIFPVIVARPWPNAKSLTTTWERISEAMGGRRYGVDLDETRFQAPSKRPIAAAAFDELFDPAGGHQNYYDLIDSLPSAIPVLRMPGGTVRDLAAQAAHIGRLDRGVIVRLRHGVTHNPLQLVPLVLDAFQDVTLVIDAGWSRDLLSLEAWASAIVGAAAQNRPEIEMVVAGSSFPDTFTNVGERRELPVRERFLFSSLVRQHNAAILTYGDWGSTRPPMAPTPMKMVPRIDLPMPGEWISFRCTNQEEFSDIARRVMADPLWPDHLNIWGTYTVMCTANDLPGAIRNAAVAAAARINIHLHRQAHYGAMDLPNDGDEPYSDD